MSRQQQQIEVTLEQLRATYKRAHIGAVILFIGFFTIFVAFAPEGDSKVDATPAMTAVVTP